MNHTHNRTQGITHSLRLLAATCVLSLAAGSSALAGNADIYGGAGADTQTIHHCGWLPTQRMIYTKGNYRNTAIIQRKLNELGYDSGAVDGVNGRLTKNAVRRFQAENGLKLVDGIVGIETSQAFGYIGHPSPWVRSCRRAYNAAASRY